MPAAAPAANFLLAKCTTSSGKSVGFLSLLFGFFPAPGVFKWKLLVAAAEQRISSQAAMR